jgi:phenylalanyl-tRNA synthetase beta chain
MLIPLSWLKTYVSPTISDDALRQRLTDSGSAIEHVLHIGEGLDDLVVAEVLEVQQHPNADRLRVAHVSTGDAQFEVVCGAPNLAAGQLVVLAPIGASVPIDMHDPERKSFTLASAKIRGVESQGMICSTAEMGLGDDHDGILVLPSNTPVGIPIPAALGYPEVVWDIEVTTNRSDELSLIGIAREAAMLAGVSVFYPITSTIASVAGTALEPLIQSDSCSRLMTQKLAVEVGPSPWWLQKYLGLAGMRSVNNVVDITNFVMLEYGQPLHSYDAAKIHGTTLTARQAKPSETLKTLDGTLRDLREAMLVIADDAGVVGIAGIMGGASSKIDATTTEIVLEAAVFNPVSIRRTANALALRSEASKRYERGVDPETTPIALKRAVSLLGQYAQAKRVGAVRDAYPAPPTAHRYTLSQSKLHQYLGFDLPLHEAQDILTGLGFDAISLLGEQLTVGVPSWRYTDIEGEEDLIEEVVRIIGYHRLPTALPSGALPRRLLNQEIRAELATKELLAQAGWVEIVAPSLTSENMINKAGLSLPKISISNPLSSEWTHMRESLLPDLLDAAGRNTSHRVSLQLFELSAVYLAQGDGLPNEQKQLAFIRTSTGSGEHSISQVTGLIVSILMGLGVPRASITFTKSLTVHPTFSPESTATICVEEQEIGTLGLVAKNTRDAFGLPRNAIAAEIAISPFLTRLAYQPLAPLPKFPSVEEDISIIVSNQVSTAEVINVLERADSPLLSSVSLVDIYHHPSLGDDKKSITLHLRFRACDHTLTGGEVSLARQLFIDALSEAGMSIRSS